MPFLLAGKSGLLPGMDPVQRLGKDALGGGGEGHHRKVLQSSSAQRNSFGGDAKWRMTSGEGVKKAKTNNDLNRSPVILGMRAENVGHICPAENYVCVEMERKEK